METSRCELHQALHELDSVATLLDLIDLSVIFEAVADVAADDLWDALDGLGVPYQLNGHICCWIEMERQGDGDEFDKLIGDHPELA